MHEAPEIPNFAQRRKGIRLAAGMTLAIEPIFHYIILRSSLTEIFSFYYFFLPLIVMLE